MTIKQQVKQVSGAEEEHRDINERIYLMNKIGTILN